MTLKRPEKNTGMDEEMEVGVDVARLRYILLDRNPMGIKIHESVEETIEALAANLDKILVVEKGKID